MINRYDLKDIILECLYHNGLIDNVLYAKCKKEAYSILPFNNQVKGSFNLFKDKIALGKDIEVWCAYDSKGDLITSNTGDSDSVGTDFDGAFNTLVGIVCKDIIDDFGVIGKDNVGAFRDALVERLNSLGDKGRVFSIHNHPTPYTDSSRDSLLPTALSGGDAISGFTDDVEVVLKGFPFPLPLYNVVKCESCVCSNGSSMTIINNNPIGTDRGYSMGDYSRAYHNLYNVWHEYVSDTESSMRRMKRDIVNELRVKYQREYPDISVDDAKKMEKDIRVEAQRRVDVFVKERNKTVYPSVFGDVIREFNGLGFDLRFDL